MQALEQFFLERCHMYFFAMEKLFQRTPIELPKLSSPKEKHQSLLHAIGGGCYMNKLCENLPLPKKRKPRKKPQEEEDKTERKLHKANQDRND